MEQAIIWFISQIADFTRSVLSWKILGDFSILHLILGFNFLIILFKFFNFGVDRGAESAVLGVNNYVNAENKKQREEYRNSYEYYSVNRSRRENYKSRYERERQR